ncbi:MAG: Ig-like domain-containing protein [Lachnospiraceae bacterium]|nr:Ig-like domain-containing protein [Lachnospiraceae bacterium]
MKKSLTKMLISLLLVAALLPVRAFAAAEVSFQIQMDGTGTVTLVSAGAAEREISSLQFSLTINAGNAARVEFEFSEDVLSRAKVAESRYQASSRTLNVYIAGTEPLFAKGASTLTVGRVAAFNAGGAGVSAIASAVPGSVKYVDGAELQEPTPTPTLTPVPTSPPVIYWPPVSSDVTPTPTPEATPTPETSPTAAPTEVPSPTAAPKPTEAVGPQMLSSLRLYLEGDVTETYSGKKFASVWNKAGYTVVFKSNNTKVATVGKAKGLVTAVSVGTAKITATFTNQKTGEKVVKTCKVTVKRNAVDAGISADNESRLQKLTVGEAFTLKTFRIDSDGNVVWDGKTKITDSVRFRSSNTKVFTVNKTTGKITAVGEGTATLTVWAVQSEQPICDENGKVIEYRTTTKPQKYKVIVSASAEEDE